MPDIIRYHQETNPYPTEWRRQRVTVRRKKGISWDAPVYESSPKVLIHLIKEQNRPPNLEAKFKELAELWRNATVTMASVEKKAMHPAYQKIIGMGPDVIPLILREMKERPSHWFWALDAVTQGEDPASNCTSVMDAVRAWIKWGEVKGYL